MLYHWMDVVASASNSHTHVAACGGAAQYTNRHDRPVVAAPPAAARRQLPRRAQRLSVMAAAGEFLDGWMCACLSC